eukprot:scaffold143435_cov43-Prasinocladus_malaysianus.AAC.1
MSINSGEQLETTFNPALMLSVGDILTFVKDASEILPSRAPPNLVKWYGRNRPQVPVEAPAMEEQLALGKPLTARVPQKYLIQNYTGVSITYWSGVSDSSSKSLHHLDQGGEETLAIEPTDHMLTALTGKSKSVMKYRAKVINIKLQGNWMPVKRIVVSHIGKSSYRVLSPHESLEVPLVVDVTLVGRTKIICLHSSVRVKNCCDVSFSMRLHMPTLDVAGPANKPVISRAQVEASQAAATSGDARPSPSNNQKDPQLSGKQAKQQLKSQALGSFSYGDELYLPIQAMFNGILYIQAEGFEESAKDAIYLHYDIASIQKQQGYVSCEAPTSAEGKQAFHCALLVKPTEGGPQSVAQASGVMQEADSAIECELQLQPTLQLQNGLPYPMFILLKASVTCQTKWHLLVCNWCKGAHNCNSWQELELEYRPQTGVGWRLRSAQRELDADCQSLEDMYGPPSIKGSYTREVTLLGFRFRRIVLPPGAIADLYVDMSNNVLGLIDVPSLHLESDRWSLIHQSALGSKKETSQASFA